MTYWRRWLSFVGLAVLAIGCGRGPSPLAEATRGLERAGRYRIEYQLTTSIAGVAQPLVASGYAEFEGAGRWRVTQGSVVMEYAGSTLRVETGDTWQEEEMAELPIYPLLYLKAAVDVRETRGGEGQRVFAFTLDRARYREAVAQVLGKVPASLDKAIARFAGNGEVAIDAEGRPMSMQLRLQDSSAIALKTRQMLQIQFVAPGEDPIPWRPLTDDRAQPEVSEDGG